MTHPRLIDLVKNYRPHNSPLERLGLLARFSVGAFMDPNRADYVAHAGDLSSQAALENIRLKMEASEVGRRILEEKPRVNSETWNLDGL